MDLVGLSWFDAGVRSFYTREKVEALADLAGLTLRVQESDMMSEMILDLGAKPAQVVYSRVYAACLLYTSCRLFKTNSKKLHFYPVQ